MVFLLSQMYLNGLTKRFDAIGIGLLVFVPFARRIEPTHL
jgi:hypothetical protein